VSRRSPPPGELPQRVLALELRYAIDVERKRATAAHFNKVARLIEDNPYGFASRHVRHNLGTERTDWLKRVGLMKEEG
jgi:hypothetical protein